MGLKRYHPSCAVCPGLTFLQIEGHAELVLPLQKSRLEKKKTKKNNWGGGGMKV